MDILRRYIPLVTHEVPSGKRVFDWTIPKEWNIRDAYVKNGKGQRVVDFRKSNLHVLNYSIPIWKTLPLVELKEHLYSLPDYPHWIPYRTSYYEENWGFCLSHDQLMRLEAGDYEVFIDSTLENGHLTYGEYYLSGRQTEEILISCHACHPSLCNDNLSGVGLATFLARFLSSRRSRYSYRFLFLPGTIGAITWLCLNEGQTSNIRHGLVITGVGDPGEITYKKSRRGNEEIDRAACHVLRHSEEDYTIIDFSPCGYDERQYCSPGFNLPVGRLSRTPGGEYPEYHTSADSLDFVQSKYLGDSFTKTLAIIDILESNRSYLNLNAKCEPQLSKRRLGSESRTRTLAMQWVLNFSDGRHSLLDIVERSNLRFDLIVSAAETLLEKGLLKEV
jgi:aminopeptidase-like protein